MESRFIVGNTYSSFKNLESEISLFEQENYVNVIKRHSRTIENAIKRGSNKQFNPDLKYAEVNYICKHGDKYHSKVVKGERPHTRTEKIECPFILKFRSSLDGQMLLLTDFVNKHNHEVSEEKFRFETKQRILSKSEQEEIARMVSFSADKKKIQQHFFEQTGKNIIMKDIHNIATRAKASDNALEQNQSEVQNLADWIKENQPALQTTFVKSEENIITGIFMQDAQMKSSFDRFPEILLVDATHKTNDRDMALYTFLTVDGNGESQVVTFFLVQSEDETSLRSMVNLFKEHNPKWDQIHVVLTDKDFTERTVFQSEIPQVQLEICLFHVMRTFNREVTVDKMNITPGERLTILDHLQDISYSASEQSYQDKYELLCNVMPDTVKQYYDKNWHPIRNQWVDGLKTSMNLCTRTNNRIESFFSKLKQVVKIRGSLKELVSGFMNTVSVLRNERRYRINRALNTVSTVPLTEIEQPFQSYLTPYAFERVKYHLNNFSKVQVISHESVQTSSGVKTVTNVHCDCSFFVNMKLPCKHILAVRQFNGLELFCTDIIASRWSVQFYKDYRVLGVSRPRLSIATQPSVSKSKTLTENQKYKKATSVLHSIQCALTNSCNVKYHERLQVLKEILAFWEQGKDVLVAEHVLLNNEEQVDNIQTDNVHNQLLPDISLPGDIQDIYDDETMIPTVSVSSVSEPESELPDINQSHSHLIQDPEPDTQIVEVTASTSDLSMVQFAPKARKRGRPKGSCTTAIGLPSKKRAKCDKPTAFHKKDTKTKNMYMLCLFVDEATAQQAISNSMLIGEESVTTIPADVPSACKDDRNINLSFVRKYFDDDGWVALQHVYEATINMPWLCQSCQEALGDTNSVGCDSCLHWFHWGCIGIKRQPKVRYWYCKSCKSNN